MAASAKSPRTKRIDPAPGGGLLVVGDCRAVMAALPPSTIDAIVTDPPYGLKFMGRDWDHGVPGLPFWAAALRVARPGAHLVAFGGTRTFRRLACALEDAGWELRDTIMWVYGSGFPKSLDVSKAIDKAAGAEREIRGIRHDGCHNTPSSLYKVEGYAAHREATFADTAPATAAARRWDGWGTALKPAWEPVLLARKPLDGTVAANIQKHGTGALNIDACRVKTGDDLNGGAYSDRKQNDGKWGTLHRKVPGIGYKQPAGRWPANLVHDGSDEVLALFPQTSTQGHTPRARGRGGIGCDGHAGQDGLAEVLHDSGSAARFFYTAKAARGEREAGLKGHLACLKCGGLATDFHWERHGGKRVRVRCRRNGHPTVKPVALMRWLLRLVTPPGGRVLDPFLGSGTTGVAAVQEGLRLVGIEQDAAYLEIARWRIAAAAGGPAAGSKRRVTGIRGPSRRRPKMARAGGRKVAGVKGPKGAA